MGDSVCFLITVLCNNRLLRCALKVKRDELQGDCIDFPMEPENKEQLHKLLPLHVRNCGSIIEVDNCYLFEIHICER